MKKNFIAWCFGMVIFLTGCMHHAVSPEEYLAYVDHKDNGLTQVQEFGAYSITLQYRPLIYEAISDMGRESAFTQEDLSARLKESEGLEYYLLRIGSTGSGADALMNSINSLRSYDERIAYLISGIEKEVKLVSGRDTFTCMMHHYERNYRMAGYHNVLFVFETKQNPEKPEPKTFIYNDQVLGIGRIRFNINTKDIKNIPQLKL